METMWAVFTVVAVALAVWAILAAVERADDDDLSRYGL